MGDTTTIAISIPSGLLEQVRHIAAQSNRQLDNVIAALIEAGLRAKP